MTWIYLEIAQGRGNVWRAPKDTVGTGQVGTRRRRLRDTANDAIERVCQIRRQQEPVL